MPVRLGFWLAFVGLMIAVSYYGRATEGKPDPQLLYEYSTAVLTVVNYAILLVITLAIAGFRLDLLALRGPRSAWRAVGVVLLGIAAIYVFELVYGTVVAVKNEQGITPSGWEPSHAAAYVVNAIVLVTVVPFVEELIYRGLGYSLLEPFGRWPAILAVGILFALAHGLVLSLPVLAAFGCIVTWVRARTGSVYPGMFLHATFNAVAVIVAVTL
jgi:hypothetical protein